MSTRFGVFSGGGLMYTLARQINNGLAGNQLLPLSNYGVKTMSIGYLVGEEAPVVWRGLMVMKALRQLLVEVEWGGLDVLVLDLPPGTGDIPLSITQQVVLDGTSFPTPPFFPPLRTHITHSA